MPKATRRAPKGGTPKRAHGKASDVTKPFRAGAPLEIEGMRVVDETGDKAAWVVDKGDGTVTHILK